MGPFEIVEKIGEVAYHLNLPPQLGHVHNVFHISMVKRYTRDPSHVLPYFDVLYMSACISILRTEFLKGGRM